MDEKDIARFWSKVDKNGPVIRPELGACWVWLGARANNYGRFSLFTPSRKVFYAHRISWALTHGDHSLCVLHHCDNPMCCNPAHLFLGTRPDNSRDMVAKGRSIRGRTGLKGSAHPRATLTEDVVASIREAHRQSGLPARSFARAFSSQLQISEANLRSLLQRRNWKHVP